MLLDSLWHLKFFTNLKFRRNLVAIISCSSFIFNYIILYHDILVTRFLHKIITMLYLQGVATRPIVASSEIVEARDSPASKVSSNSKTNENKGVNINRSHEVPGKSSTDGTSSDASTIVGSSRDILAKAKITLQRQKELAERMKKLPSVSSYASLFLCLVLYF